MQAPRVLLVLSVAAGVASAFRVCEEGQEVTIRASDRDDNFRDYTQYILVSPRTTNVTYSVEMLGCERNWTSTMDLSSAKDVMEVDVNGEVDTNGRRWYEVSFHYPEAGFLMVQLNLNYHQYRLDGRMVNCSADKINITFTNETMLGHYCMATPTQVNAEKTGLGVIGIVTIVGFILALVVIVDLVCFFRYKQTSLHKDSMDPDEAMSAARTPEEAAISRGDLDSPQFVTPLPWAPTDKSSVQTNMSAQLVSNEVIPDGALTQTVIHEVSGNDRGSTGNAKKKTLVRKLVARPQLMSQFSHEPLVEYL